MKHDLPTVPERVPTEILRQTVQEAKDLGFTHFAFLGGEPSIRENFHQILQPLQTGDCVESVMAISNMLQFHENMYRAVENMYRAVFQTEARHAQIVASIDSLNEPNFKHQSVAQTLRNVERIQEVAKEYLSKGTRNVQVHSVISRENFRHLVSHVQFFAQRDIDVSMAIVEPFRIVGSPQSCVQYNYFTSSEIQEIIDQFDILESMDRLNWANRVAREYLISTQVGLMDQHIECTAGSAHAVIDSYGNVFPCLTNAYHEGPEFGNIMKEPFRSIYCKMCGFHCESAFQQTCWDHYLWTKLEKVFEGKN